MNIVKLVVVFAVMFAVLMWKKPLWMSSLAGAILNGPFVVDAAAYGSCADLGVFKGQKHPDAFVCDLHFFFYPKYDDSAGFIGPGGTRTVSDV